jgi:hypothetical protein
MGRKKVYAMIASLVAVAAVALLLGFVVIPGSSTGTLSTTVTASSGNPSEGVVVHGYWTVDVLNPDGTLAEHREFENAFQAGGSEVLTNILVHKASAGRWYVALYGDPGPCYANGQNDECVSVELKETGNSPNFFKNLDVKKTGYYGSSVLHLSGFVTIVNATSISKVLTRLGFCGETVSPYDCVSSATYSELSVITSADLSPIIAVQAGQIVQVTVKISFVV